MKRQLDFKIDVGFFHIYKLHRSGQSNVEIEKQKGKKVTPLTGECKKSEGEERRIPRNKDQLCK